MNKTDLIRYWKLQLRTTIPRLLGFYILIPLVLLKLLAKPIGDAVLRSDAACFRILLAALAAVGLNWYVYYLIRKKRPSLLVFAFGALFLLIVTAIEHETFESTYYLRSTLAVIGGFLLVAFLFLLAQGREVIVYVLDPQGAHLQTWHQPSRIKSWARLQSADPRQNIPQQDGSVMHLSQERHMIWNDVQSVRYKPRNAAILIYHTPYLAPMVLKLPPDEYEMAAAYVGKYCKGK